MQGAGRVNLSKYMQEAYWLSTSQPGFILRPDPTPIKENLFKRKGQCCNIIMSLVFEGLF